MPLPARKHFVSERQHYLLESKAGNLGQQVLAWTKTFLDFMGPLRPEQGRTQGPPYAGRGLLACAPPLAGLSQRFP